MPDVVRTALLGSAASADSDTGGSPPVVHDRDGTHLSSAAGVAISEAVRGAILRSFPMPGPQSGVSDSQKQVHLVR